VEGIPHDRETGHREGEAAVMRGLGVVLALLAGCRTAPPDAVSNTRGSDDVDSLVARADAAVNAAALGDYALPLSTTRRSPIHDASELYGRACLEGHVSSCWKRLSIPMDRIDLPAERPFIDELVRHCESGNLLACRAIYYVEDVPVRLLGAAGRDERCHRLEASCDRALLQHECEAGMPASCEYLSIHLGENKFEVMKSPWFQRADRISLQGCKLGIIVECGMGDRQLELMLPRHKLSCRYDWNACASAAGYIEPSGRIIEARDLMERACQMGARPDTCVELGWRYRAGKFPEPVPARGHALSTRMCPRFEGSDDQAYLCDGYPTPEGDD
jgi:hypothetical protein